MKARILIVDDEAPLQKALVKFLASQGYQAEGADDGAQAIEMFKNKIYDLVITDLKMPSMSGIDLIKILKKIHAKTVFIVMTGFGTIESAVQAMKEGAFHYITKPFDLEDAALLVDKALQFQKLKDDHGRLKQQVRMNHHFDHIVGLSESMKNLFQQLGKISQSDSHVLILGESGTGKELIARCIHYNSPREAGPLVAVNCAAIPEDLLEAELFGYVKGAFTGAVNNNQGKFQAAHGGTLFLDEIGGMSQKLQVKLLRVIQERCFEPLGSTQTIETDVRLITATHQNLEEMVKRGQFREDLYYRINVIPVGVPPLRERTCDIPPLIDRFLNEYTRKNNTALCEIPDEVMNVFMAYQWPGNVRELENTIERLVVLKPGQKVKKQDLPEKFHQGTQSHYFNPALSIPENGLSLKKVVNDFESTLIQKALDKTGWNKNRAAHLLKLNRTTLVEKIKKMNLSRTENSQRGPGRSLAEAS